MLVKIWRFATLMLTSLSLSLGMAHLLELPQRMKFDQQLWVRVTVFEGVYNYFGLVGPIFELGAILSAAVLTFLVRGRGKTFYLTLAGTICLMLAFVSWLIFVAPANAEFARWLTSPVPPNWSQWRDRWEYAHAINAIIKIIGLSLLVLSVVVETPGKVVRQRNQV